MLIKRPPDISSSEITEEGVYHQRRKFLQQSLALGLGAGIAAHLPDAHAGYGGEALTFTTPDAYRLNVEKTAYKDVTTYNNFYEFSTSKYAPARKAHTLRTRPWSIRVEGECAKPGVVDIEDVLKRHALEERIYRFRCVEGWSMVIPWVGFSLSEMLKQFEPTSRAKYVMFETLVDPEQFPNQKGRVLDWPYQEGLRIDEAMNPLTLMAVGLYGEVLPNQNGAPIRLVVPWKYGFKSIKSIVKIKFVETMPKSTWMKASSREYGFYSNVNPEVSHPRWSQRRERRIGEWGKRDTLMFNGYAEQVAHLYKGMDLQKYF
ncbi:MAG: protein-methionine-sulfoxide reductase catalytic subunit MsrP [Gammaproteobacteria bacterium]|nr:protein-methionine-sulfoxide reductase catalytic subunit MsrP [Gammaproteobacteria bacterium]